MNNFRWNNETKEFSLWDFDKDLQVTIYNSDKRIINTPDRGKFEDVLNALCRVVSELVEIEEKRSAK